MALRLFTRAFRGVFKSHTLHPESSAITYCKYKSNMLECAGHRRNFGTSATRNAADNQKQDNLTLPKQETDAPFSVSTKFKVFEEEGAEVINDYLEELQMQSELQAFPQQENIPKPDPYAEQYLQRGVSGVFDLPELVDLLHGEKVKDIAVIAMPRELKYADYMVIGTTKSIRHQSTTAEFVRKVYKWKRHETDKIPRIEGERCEDWTAIDLGNIIMHLFSESARIHYDIEMLWAVGPEYDDKTNNISDNQSDLLMQNSLSVFEPAH